MSWPISRGAAPPTLMVALAALTFLGPVACGEADSDGSNDDIQVQGAPQAPGTRVEVATLGRTKASLDIVVPGEVQGSRDALLATPQGGYVESVLVKEGQRVGKGKALARINTSMMSAQQDQIEAQLQQARDELARVEALGDLASPSQLQAAQTQVKVLEANEKIAAINTARSLVTAPFAGIVSSVGVESGEVAGPGSPVVRLIQLDPVEVSVSISDRDIGALQVGQPAAITVDALARPFQGTITHLDPAADPRTRSFLAKIEVPNPDGLLKPGMIASAQLESATQEDAIVLPQDWLVTGRQGIGVFVVEEEKAVWRPIVPGPVVHDQIVITEGLSEGERVVMTGHRNLVEGDQLIVAREGTCCTNGRALF